MKLSSLFLAAALLSMNDHTNDSPLMTSAPARLAETGALRLGQTEPPSTPVALGDAAPDFSYQAADGRWRHLHDLLLQGAALLVFGADEAVLRAVERERERLLDLGVIPVAIVDTRGGAARAMVQRHQLQYMVLADPRGVIAGQFNAVDSRTGRTLPCLFVLDRSRRVRGLLRTRLPLQGYAALAANSLGLPVRGRTVPAAR